ncbi:hypothetical protein [Natrialba sp. SSL1]|uniref:hypothetical protein n=1 Tax=Natrialba sp. SSL1 TaxID=1869245 RepID=UPI0008F80592|nr:hypothetical protein [Natrialba sp. SSL1]OIB59131.1 hypothetical protein BBD46_00145 [Natrialba sp. SSL1]
MSEPSVAPDRTAESSSTADSQANRDHNESPTSQAERPTTPPHQMNQTSDPSHSPADRRDTPAASQPLSLRVRAIAFWSAIVLPFVYVPLLLTGLSTWVESMLFLFLLGCNLVALYVGHEHCQSNDH